MTTGGRDVFKKYTVALVAVAAAMAARALLTPLIGPGVPFITLYPALAFVALYCGFGPGLAATFLGGAAANFIVMEPVLTLTVSSRQESVQIVLFLAMGAFLSWIVSDRQRISATLEDIKTSSEIQAREAVEALRESEERSQLAQFSTGVGIWEWDLL